MKIAVLADIHANFRALQAVGEHVDRWRPDAVWVAGDTVNRGPCSPACLDYIQARQRAQGWRVIRGNHEDYIINQSQPDIPKSGPTYEMLRPIHWTVAQLAGRIPELATLPEQISQRFAEAGEVRMVHASMRGNRVGIYPESTEEELRRLVAPAPAVILVGHTHRPLVRNLDHPRGKTLVVNAGSVGLPFDGDTRTGYAQLTIHQGEWQARMVRLPYDLDLAQRDYLTSGFLQGGGPLVKLILLELDSALSQLYQWVGRYSQEIEQGCMTVSEAVEDFLKTPISQPYW
ncbi:MAG: metallophosphoesterase family protein [Anaerolineales bacterium]|nr:metallophosphoesterase family protein [Anaerolineales bacterium]